MLWFLGYFCKYQGRYLADFPTSSTRVRFETGSKWCWAFLASNIFLLFCFVRCAQSEYIHAKPRTKVSHNNVPKIFVFPSHGRVLNVSILCPSSSISIFPLVNGATLSHGWRFWLLNSSIQRNLSYLHWTCFQLVLYAFRKSTPSSQRTYVFEIVRICWRSIKRCPLPLAVWMPSAPNNFTTKK